MMLHQDGSRHDWLGGQPALDLIVTLNDATGTIDSAFLAGEEGTASTCRAEGGLLRARPANESLHRSWGALLSHPKSWRPDRSGHSTQVGRALEQLSVEHIGAYSPHSPSRDGRSSERPRPGAVRSARSERRRIVSSRNWHLQA